MKPYFENGVSTLYNGDCFRVVPELASMGVKVDKIITSPPYNIRNNRPDRRYDVYDDIISNDEYIERIMGLFSSFDSILNPNGCIMWNMSYGGENSELLPLCIGSIVAKTAFTMADVLVWKKKTNGIPNNVSPNKMTRGCEFVFVFCRRSEFKTFTSNKRVISRRKNGNPCYENYYNYFEAENGECIDLNHSTFSVGFVDQLLMRYVRPDDVVMDPFSGTGTTMVACDCKGIKGVYVELSEAQCTYTLQRMSGPVAVKGGGFPDTPTSGFWKTEGGFSVKPYFDNGTSVLYNGDCEEALAEMARERESHGRQGHNLPSVQHPQGPPRRPLRRP